eukprot:359622-Chlamydomonas_euryale.AAC.20
MPLSLRPWAFTCMHVLGLRLASTSAGVIGLDLHLDACSVHGPPRLSHKGKRSGPLMHILHTQEA